MTNLVKQEDVEFITRFLSAYKLLNEGDQNLVLAFVQGMQFQKELNATTATDGATATQASAQS